MGQRTKTAPAVKPDTPNLDKMVEVHEESNAIGAFIDWLQDQGVTLMRWESVPHERPCTNFKPPQDRMVLEEIVALEAEFRRGDPIDIPELGHPSTCPCEGTGYIRWTEEGWERAMSHGGDTAIARLMAPYYEIDYDEMMDEREAVLAWVRRMNGVET